MSHAAKVIRCLVILILSAMIFTAGPAAAQSTVPSRIAGPIKNEERITVPHSTPELVKHGVDAGRMAGGQPLGRMLLVLNATPEQEQAAAQLVAAQHDSSSPLFHKWLTPAQFGERFGAAADDAQKVQHWLETQGFTVHEVSQSRRFIAFSGSVAQVEQAFSTQMHNYTLSGQKFIANSTDIQIPAALASVVKGVARLNSVPHQSSLKIGEKVKVNRKTGQLEFAYGLHVLSPTDFATIYNLTPLYNAGINGAGETIAIVTRSSLVDTNLNVNGLHDIHDFRNVMGLPANDPEMIVNGDDPITLSQGDAVEALLDVTWAGAVAPMAHIKAVASQSNFTDGTDVSAAYIVDHNLAPIMSMSFNDCEQNLGPVLNAHYNALWQQAAAQGITVFVSAGDNGGAGCDSQSSGGFALNGVAVNGLASTPYNVAVGGTQFDDVANPALYWAKDNDPATLSSALSYIPEKVWNESSNDPFFTSLWAGSGGVSTVYPKPDWQTAAGVPNDGMRDLPDLSLAAAGHTSYALCWLSSCSSPGYIGLLPVAGTSAASPSAAGIMALVLQKMNGQPQGLANYVFYKLASTQGIYHDILHGDNKVPDPNGQFTVGYDAGSGYDRASGLGSFDATALVNNWASAVATSSSSTTLALAQNQPTSIVHGTPVTFQASVTCTGNGCAAPTGAVALQGSSATGDFAGLGSVPLTPGAPTSTATATASAIPGGTYGVSARYTGDGKYYASTSSPISITVTPENSQMAVGGISGNGNFLITSPLTLAYAEPITLYVAVAGLSGNGHPTGAISLLVDGVAPPTVARDFVTPTTTLTLNYGETTNFFSNGVALSGQSSVFPNLSPVFPAGTHQVQAAYPGDNSFNSIQGNYSFVVTKADTMIADFFPIGTAIANIPVTLAGQIALTNNSCAPYGGTVTVTDYTPTPPVVLASAPASQQYCDSYSVPVTFTTGGSHLLRVTFSGDTNVNGSYSAYNFPVATMASSNINLSTSAPSANAGSPVSLIAQVASDVRKYTATGSVTFLDGATTLGTATLDSTGTATIMVNSLAPGTHSINANYAGDSILQASSGGPAMVNIADYSVQAQPANLNIVAGQTGSTSLKILPIGGSTQTVQFSCGTLPADISCTFAPATVTLDGTNIASVQLTVSTRLATAAAFPHERSLGIYGSVAFAILLLPFGRRRRLKSLLGLLCLALVAITGVGCGGSGNSSVARRGTYVVNVSAASTGATAKTTPVVITVQ